MPYALPRAKPTYFVVGATKHQPRIFSSLIAGSKTCAKVILCRTGDRDLRGSEKRAAEAAYFHRPQPVLSRLYCTEQRTGQPS